MQAHVEPGNVAACGCACNAMEHTLAAFLIGAGENSYYGTGRYLHKIAALMTPRVCLTAVVVLVGVNCV